MAMAIDPKRVKEIFLEAAELSDDAARAAYLDEACRDEAGLRERVDALLQSHEPQGSFLAVPAAVVPEPDHHATQALTGTPEPSAADSQTAAAENSPADDEALTFLAPPTRPDALGRIGRYEVLQVLGRGGFGIVFRALDQVLQRVVALKVMAPLLAATSPARKRFLREARSSAQVRHENVVQVYEIGEQPLPYLAMEFIPGETLQQKLDRVGPLEVPEVLRIGRQIAEGLAAAHAMDLIHRDIKPGNVLLEGGQQKVKITDFGLARTADDASISQSGIIAGTPMYMAPEQAQGQTLDQRADLFSLGSVLYQMVAGRPPFRANSTVAVLKRVAEDTPRAIREIIPETPHWLCDIIGKLHAKNPDDRYQSAREVADVLADCEAQLKANAKLKDYSRIPQSKPQRSGRWKQVAAAAAVLLPVFALAVSEFAGVTHLFQGQRPSVALAPQGDPKSDPRVDVQTDPRAPLATGDYALLFDGRTSYVEVPTLKRNDPGPYTIEFRIKLTEPGTRGVIVSMDGAAACQIQLQDHDRPLLAACERSKEGDQSLDHGVNIVPGEWYHVAYVLGSSESILFLNGHLVDRGPRVTAGNVAPHPPTNRSNTLLGSQRYAGVKSFHSLAGYFDEVRISNVARYDKAFVPAERFEPDADTLALYHFDEGRGDVLKDSSGNGHHGQIVGAKWVKVDGSPSGAPPAAKMPPLAVVPFTDADVQRITALSAAEQVEEVRKELMRRNPGFGGKVEHKIEGGAVTELRIVTDRVTDIAPVRALTRLQSLTAHGGSSQSGSLADLSPLRGLSLTLLNAEDNKVRDLAPLRGMPLKGLEMTCNPVGDLAPLKGMALEYLFLWQWTGSDLTPLAGMPLKRLNLGGGQKSLDLTSLAGMPLEYLCVNHTEVSDLTPLKHAPLRKLECSSTLVSDVSPLQGMQLMRLTLINTQLSDVSPLKGMPLEEIRLTPKYITRGLDILRDMKSLKTIGIGWHQSWPAADFWQRYDKGEFK